MIRGLGTEIVVQIAAGDRHSMALTKAGQLFVWGDNQFGQLGIGKVNGNKADTPQVIYVLLKFIELRLLQITTVDK
jgi:E3 ubiquitin-protein ligase HERC4